MSGAILCVRGGQWGRANVSYHAICCGGERGGGVG